MSKRKLGFLVLACTLLLGVLTACNNDEPAASVQASKPPAAASDGPVLGTLAFTGSELAFAPQAVTVDAPGRYGVTFTNEGHIEHDWVAGDVRLVAQPGETVSGEIVVPPAGLEFVCSVPGHAPAGMHGRISVKDGAGS
jgi:uncharacterized cupredoxin-like copper-binding protein